MADIFGRNIRICVFGESRGAAVGVSMDGVPSGIALDMEQIRAELIRRAPNDSISSTERRESDSPKIVSGVYNGVTTGDCLTALIYNEDARDSADVTDVIRPGHADYTSFIRSGGANDPRGGGHISGRLTAPIVFAGAVLRQWLASYGISATAQVYGIGGKREGFNELIESAKADGDSVGGVIECAIEGVPAGVGEPFFDSIEATLAHLMFSIPAVIGVEFGAGFAGASLRGSEFNDIPYSEGGKLRFLSNNAGGVNGGVSNGESIVFRVAVKPTPSISRPQQTVSLKSGRKVEYTNAGRNDVCIVPRAVPVVEAMALIGVAELWKERLSKTI